MYRLPQNILRAIWLLAHSLIDIRTSRLVVGSSTVTTRLIPARRHNIEIRIYLFERPMQDDSKSQSRRSGAVPLPLYRQEFHTGPGYKKDFEQTIEVFFVHVYYNSVCTDNPLLSPSDIRSHFNRRVFIYLTHISSVGMIKNFYTFAEDHGETRVLKRESGEKPELCPQRYILKHLA